MRNSETLRTALFAQIEGLQDGSVKPETAKATAACAMAICKTVDLDLRASEMFKGKLGEMKSLQLTSDAKPEAEPVVEIDDDTRALILKGHTNGLDSLTIAKRVGMDITDVELVIELST